MTVSDPALDVNRTQATDSAGIYYVPSSLPVGTYSVEVKATGLAPTEAKGIVLDVGTTVTQDFKLTVACFAQVVEVQETAALVDTSTTSLGAVVNQLAVQEIPLNGRHFTDLPQMIVGTVTGPRSAT